jgi:hypothetical protein
MKISPSKIGNLRKIEDYFSTGSPFLAEGGI